MRRPSLLGSPKVLVHALIFFILLPEDALPTPPRPKYSLNVVHTKYGPLRGVELQPLHSERKVEAYLGVPYATPPLGNLRYMPPVTPSTWKEVRVADTFSPVCPQKAPEIGNRSEALLELPRGRLLYLEKLLPLLANQSEDCLYLNIYVPEMGNARNHNNLLPVILYVHGESYEWNSGNPYDGSVLAAYGQLIVVTINFRLGILGFLKTGARASAQGNFGLMDLVAGLHWLRQNIPAFRGDPDRITVMGHGTGAALANFIAVSPVAKELLHRVILLSGSGLSPWALQREPLTVKRKVAEQTGCHGDLVTEDLAPCLRGRPLSALLGVRLDPPRFLAGFGPFVDGTVLPSTLDASGLSGISIQQQVNAISGPGFEYADFGGKEVLLGLTTTESYLDLSAQDLEFGFNETRRDRILRTYVRNCYLYHLNEIFSTLKNEYTDWERPAQNPLSARDSALEVLSDGHTAAPLVRVGYLNTLRGGTTYFMHFSHQSGERDFPQRSGSVRGEDVPYILGLPIVGGQPYFPHNYSRQDSIVSKQLIQYIANFARRGDPNGGNRQRTSQSTPNHVQVEGAAERRDDSLTFWDTYDAINQLYLELGTKTEMKNHYRGHKMSLWLNLIPQLHRPGIDDLNMRHHHFQEEGAQFYDGSVRPQTLQRPSLQTSTTASTTATSTMTTPLPNLRDPSTTTECPPNVTGSAVSQNTQPNSNNANNNYNLFRKLASSHYQSYTTALTVTIAVGCFLLLLNILIFAGIYHQRERTSDKKKDEMVEIGSCSSSSGDIEIKHALAASGAPMSSHHKLSSGSLTDMPLQEFQCSPPSGVKKPSCTPPPPLPGYEPPPPVPQRQTGHILTSPSIPEPPPPPKHQPPSCQLGGGILRQQGCPQTPSCSKKRVQIQEISV